MKILLLTFHFPPTNKVGGKRWMNLICEGSKSGEIFHVVCPKTRHLDELDETLFLGDMIHRVFIPFFNFLHKRNSFFTRILKRIFLIDKFDIWIIPAFIAAMRLSLKNKYEVIIASGPPFSTFISAYLISLLFGTPLVLDYRDPWTANKHIRRHGLISSNFLKRLEQMIVCRSSGVVFCTQHMLKQFQTSFESVDCHCQSKVITNGFSQVDPPKRKLNCEVITICYAGTFYGERSILLIADAGREFSETIGKLNLVILGPNLPTKDLQVLKATAPNLHVLQEGFLNYKQLKNKLKEADVLLLISGDSHHYAIPYKLYDYIESGVPVLAIAPEHSAVHNIVTATECGEFAPIGDSIAIRDAMFSVISSKDTYSVKHPEIYLWSALAKAYFDFLSTITKN